MQRIHRILFFALWLGVAGSAAGQVSPQQLAEVNRAAMEAYNNLDVEAARKKLEGAVRQAERAGLHGPAVARTYANLGVVLVGGLGDTQGGYSAFESALSEDARVEPDPIVATPEIMQVFQRAQGAAGEAPAPSDDGALPPVEDPGESGSGGQDAECPPNMPGCSGAAGLGDTCSYDTDCQEGLHCLEDFCSLDDGDDDGDDSGYKKFFLEVNFGLAATLVSTGSQPDQTPSEGLMNEIYREVRDANGFPDGPAAQQMLFENGYDCDIQIQETSISARACTVALKKTGFVAAPVLNAALGYYLSPRLALALTGRFQMRRGEGFLAGILLGGRLDYLLTKPAPEGARVAAFIGAGVGSIQARPLADAVGSKGPFASSSNPNGVGAAAQAGLRAGYRFTPNIGIHVAPILSAGLPNFLFNVDVVGGLDLAF